MRLVQHPLSIGELPHTEPLPNVFFTLQYFEKFLPLIDSLSSTRKC